MEELIIKYKKKISGINKKIYSGKDNLTEIDRARLNVRKACYMQVIADLIVLENELE